MYELFTNRELAARLDINLAKWKRWSREFLPPDPLGGLQSGYARQYNFNDAFMVFLGGYLVSALKFPIPEARRILGELNQWLLEHGFYREFGETARPSPEADLQAKEFHIEIYTFESSANSDSPFRYRISGILADKPAEYRGYAIRQRFYTSVSIPDKSLLPDAELSAAMRCLNISTLQRRFSEAVLPGNQK
jgi:hypothetical protein